jgi:hypothetical protein
MIVFEIEYWRKHKLLPEQYCDFLQNLYLEQPGERPSGPFGLSASAIRNSHWTRWMFIFSIFALICFVVLHFNSFPAILQIVTAVLTAAVCYSAGFSLRRTRPAAGYVWLAAGNLGIIGFTLLLLWLHGLANPLNMLLAFTACGVISLGVGLAAGTGGLQFCGWLMLLCVYGYALTARSGESAWPWLELHWLPVCMLFIWLGWALHSRNQSFSAGLLSAGGLVWFFPQFIEGFYSGFTEQVQYLLLAKLILAGGVLFGFRKRWAEWIV